MATLWVERQITLLGEGCECRSLGPFSIHLLNVQEGQCLARRTMTGCNSDELKRAFPVDIASSELNLLTGILVAR